MRFGSWSRTLTPDGAAPEPFSIARKDCHVPPRSCRMTTAVSVGHATAIRVPRTATEKYPVAPDPTVVADPQERPRLVDTRQRTVPNVSLSQHTATVDPAAAIVGKPVRPSDSAIEVEPIDLFDQVRPPSRELRTKTIPVLPFVYAMCASLVPAAAMEG